jgi:hypothetical protein
VTGVHPGQPEPHRRLGHRSQRTLLLAGHHRQHPLPARDQVHPRRAIQRLRVRGRQHRHRSRQVHQHPVGVHPGRHLRHRPGRAAVIEAATVVVSIRVVVSIKVVGPVVGGETGQVVPQAGRLLTEYRLPAFERVRGKLRLRGQRRVRRPPGRLGQRRGNGRSCRLDHRAHHPIN